MPPGKRRIRLSSAEGFFASEISAEGAPISGPVIDIAQGADVRVSIVASDEVGTLKGFVVNGDRPVAGVLAVLAPKKESTDPGDYRGFQTDSDGSFDYQNVRAGEYVLFAVDRLDMEYSNPAAVRPYLAQGTSISIPARGSVTQNVSLSNPAPEK